MNLPTDDDAEWYFLDLNPEPWTAPNVAVGRAKGGKSIPRVYKNAGLRAYQEAVKDVMAGEGGRYFGAGDPIDVTFFFWRQLPAYKTDAERRARKHYADATNMQKALEDALQGVLFHNDRDVRRIESWIVEQAHDTRPLVGIRVAPATVPPAALFVRARAWLTRTLGRSDAQPDYQPETLF